MCDVSGARLGATCAQLAREEGRCKRLEAEAHHLRASAESQARTAKEVLSQLELTKSAVEYDLRKLNTSYIDLMLMHSPFGLGCTSTWSALEELVRAKKLRAIGISNFAPKDIEKMCANGGCTIPPAVNQIEFHAGMGPDPAGVYH